MSKFCGKCGVEVREEDTYCPKCGFNLKETVATIKTDEIKLEIPKSIMLKCRKCGVEVSEEDTYCPKCGFNFSNLKEIDEIDATVDEIKLEIPKSRMLKCESCGGENEEGAKFCKNCAKSIGIKFPIEEFGYLKSEFGFLKEDLRKESNYFKEELKSAKEKIDSMADKFNKKKENLIGTKVAGTFVLINGISNLTMGGIIIGFGNILGGALSMLSNTPGIGGIGGIGNQIQPVNAITDTIMSAGMFYLAIGILCILLPYYLWQGNKTAAILAIIVILIDIAASFYQLRMLLDIMPKEMGNGLIIMFIPQIIILILPIILINSEWNNLK